MSEGMQATELVTHHGEEPLSSSLELRRLIIVDDEPFIVELLRRWLEAEGYECTCCRNTDEAWRALSARPHSLVLSDITMPGGSGLELLQRIKETYAEKVAVMMVTGVSDRETAVDCLRRGAYGYLIKPLDRKDVLIQVESSLERRRLAIRDRAFQESLEQKVRERTADVRSREQEIVWRLLWVADRHDMQSSAHLRRIGLYARALGAELGWEGQRLDDLKLAAAMHDIGKVGIPDAILRKQGPLSDEEWEVMRRHTVIGSEILGDSNIPLLQLAADIALTHHERWDGDGYPRGLSGTDIPEAGRIVAIVDVYDALSSDRHYRDKFSEEETLEMMREERGAHFDPEMLDIFLSIQPDLSHIRRRGPLSEEG